MFVNLRRWTFTPVTWALLPESVPQKKNYPSFRRILTPVKIPESAPLIFAKGCVYICTSVETSHSRVFSTIFRKQHLPDNFQLLNRNMLVVTFWLEWVFKCSRYHQGFSYVGCVSFIYILIVSTLLCKL